MLAFSMLLVVQVMKLNKYKCKCIQFLYCFYSNALTIMGILHLAELINQTSQIIKTLDRISKAENHIVHVTQNLSILEGKGKLA